MVDEAVDVVNHLFHVCHVTGATNWARSAYVIMSLPILVICGVGYTIYWWDYHLIVVCIGVLLNLILGILFKELLGVNRRLPNCGVGFSMPSMYTFLAAYLVTYFSYLLFEASIREEKRKGKIRQWIRIAANWVYLIWLSVEKILIGHNTWQDVTMGWLLGIPFAIGMVYFMSRFLEGTEETYVFDDSKTD